MQGNFGMFNTHLCKNCFKSYSGKPEVCPFCGEPTGYSQAKADKKAERAAASEGLTNGNQPNVNYVEADSVVKPQKHKKRRFRVSSKQIMEEIKFEDLMQKTNSKDVNSWRERKKERNKPQFSVQNNGEYNIDTSDVTYLPSTYTYSVKKARGEVNRVKPKWWEIYKWADIMLARRKVKKQVKRASYYKPKEFKLWKMYILCILFGWFGLHDYYARNYRKGLVASVCFTVGCAMAFNWLDKLMFTAGLFLFIPICMWILDIINLIFSTYSYRLSRYKFIDCLNADTRATLGFKYLDKDEYKKPWVVRMINKIKVAVKNKKAAKAQNKQNAGNASLAAETASGSAAKAQTQIDSAQEVAAEAANINTQNVNNEQKTAENNNKQSKNKKAKVVVKTNKKYNG